jgi:hypothetical protein
VSTESDRSSNETFSPFGHTERLELNRSANGRYYWKLVVIGEAQQAAERAVAIDEWLREHFGSRLAPDPEDVE